MRRLHPLISRRAVLAGGTAFGFKPFAAGASPGVRRVVRLGQNNSAAAPSGQACRAFAASVAADSLLGPVLHVDVYDDAALGDELAALQFCVDGTVDMVLSSTTVIGSVAPEVGLLDTPFLFRDAPTARAVLDGAVGDTLREILRAKGLNVLAWGENGLRQMTADKPIRRPADLVGLKLRVPQSDVELASFRALGAQPKPLMFTALYEALRTGEFQAQENPIAIIEAAKLYEVQKVVSMTTHIYSASIVVASQDLLDDLSPAQREALTRCAREAGAVSRRLTEEAQRDGVARLRAAGMQVVTDVDIPAFVAASKPNLAAMGQKYGPELMARLIAAGS